MPGLISHHEYVSALRVGSKVIKTMPTMREDDRPHWQTGAQVLYTVVEVEHIAVEGHKPMDYHRGKTHAVITFDGIPWPVILPLTGNIGGWSAPAWHGED